MTIVEQDDNSPLQHQKSIPLSSIEAGVLLQERYEIISLLGKGAFAETYLALDKELKQQVAIKAFHPEKVDTWKSYELFEREVKTLQSLKHQGIPSIYDYFETGAPHQTSFIVLEYIEGELLQDRIASGRCFDQVELLELLLKLLDVLHYLHNRVPPLLHRDIKPSNIIIRGDGSPVLIDFGSVRTIFKAPDERGSTIIGTYGYMPYEQYMGQASPTSDLYSLAATFLEIVTGRAPGDFINKDGVIVIPEELNCPLVLKNVFHKMLDPAVSNRIQTVKEVKQYLLSPILDGENRSLTRLPSSQSLSIVEKLPAPPRRIEKNMATYYQQYAPNWKKLICMNSQGELPDSLSRGDKAKVTGFFTLSLGLAPLGVWLYQKHLEKKYRCFFERGLLTQGRIDNIIFQQHKDETHPKYRVMYSFEVDGQLHRGALVLRTSMAQFWNKNTPVHILYLPKEKYKSIILGEV